MVGIAQAVVTELPVRWVRIPEAGTFFRYVDVGLLCGDREFEFDIRSVVQVNRGNQFFETFFRHPDGVFSGHQIGRGKPARLIRHQDDRLGNPVARNFDTRIDDHCPGRVFDRAGDGVGLKARCKG